MGEYEGELNRLVDELNRSARRERSDDKTVLDQLLAAAVQRNASDLLLVAGSAAILRVNGALTPGVGRVMSDADLRGLLLPILTAEQQKELQTRRSLDFSFVRKSIGRFRANFHFQRGTIAAAIRVLPEQVPTLENLHLPPGLATLADRKQGLVLLTGPTGCGKSSTLAALLELVNTKRRDHIITIEDPIEYEHSNRTSVVEQIELGHDTPSFAEAVRAAMRQVPNVILIGEMRDAETMSAALTAAETGHLVFSSLHTNDAAQTVLRILDIFPSRLPIADPAATFDGAAGGDFAAPAARGKWSRPTSGSRNHAGHQRHPQPDSPGARPPDSRPHRNQPPGRHDDHGAVIGGTGADRARHPGNARSNTRTTRRSCGGIWADRL